MAKAKAKAKSSNSPPADIFSRKHIIELSPDDASVLAAEKVLTTTEQAAPYVFPRWVDAPARSYQRVRSAGIPVFRWDEVWPDLRRIPADTGSDWAVHVALVDDGVVIAAAVAQPSRGDVFSSVATPTPARSKRVIVVSRSRPPAKAQAIAEALGATLVPMGSAGVKALAVVRGEALAYVHEGGLNEWDAAAPVGVALAHGLHVSDLQGRAIVFNQHDVVLHRGLIICRAECAAAILNTLK